MARLIASGSVSNAITAATGPKISSCLLPSEGRAFVDGAYVSALDGATYL